MAENKIRLSIIIVAIIGEAVSLYLTVLHLSGQLPPCGSGGCAIVQSSSWSELAGIPIAAFGVGAYGLIIIAAIVRGPLASMIGLIIAFAGLLFSAYLKYLEIFQIGAICQWCLVSTVAIVICFLLSLARFRITEKDAIK